MSLFDDIIIGISTGSSVGAISIIRLSGTGVINLVSQYFKGKDLNQVESHTINYGFMVDQAKNVVDEVLVSVFKAPKTYTKEDVVEINCHGGLFVTNKIYEILVLAGARPAEPGEFTKRAYLNGRIDLSKAEAVMDMIEAENNNAVKMAGNALCGSIKRTVDNLRERILNVIATINVNIDYPEYDDIEELTANNIQPNIYNIKKDIEKLLEGSVSAKYLKSGIDTAIIGKPNVGKSSLLNALVEEQKAIVTAIPGTTRDLVEAKINLGSLTLNLIDTAGIRDTTDVVEKIGVERSVAAIDKALFVLLVIDGSTKIDSEDLKLWELIKPKKHLVIINKKDLGVKIDLSIFDEYLIMSTFEGSDVDLLKERIKKIIGLNDLNNNDITYISNSRQIEKLNLANKSLQEALDEINDNAYIDFIETPLRAAWMYLGEIIGETSTESLIDELFSKFCLGK